MAGLARLHEVKNEWTIDELLDAHEVLDIRDEAEHHAYEAARRRSDDS